MANDKWNPYFQLKTCNNEIIVRIWLMMSCNHIILIIPHILFGGFWDTSKCRVLWSFNNTLHTILFINRSGWGKSTRVQELNETNNHKGLHFYTTKACSAFGWPSILVCRAFPHTHNVITGASQVLFVQVAYLHTLDFSVKATLLRDPVDAQDRLKDCWLTDEWTLCRIRVPWPWLLLFIAKGKYKLWSINFLVQS